MPDLSAPLENPWPRIDRWLRAHAPFIGQQLSGPATVEALHALERSVRAPVPASLKEAYFAHDGAREERPTVFAAARVPREAEWARWMWWLPMYKARARHQFMLDLGIGWSDRWLPFGEDAGGNVLYVDLRSGEVFAWDHETGEGILVAPDLRTWMTWLADDMDARLVASRPDAEEEDLTLLDAPLAPLPVAPAVTAARTARSFLEVLEERGLVAVDEGMDQKSLLDALSTALAIRNAEKRRARTIAVLESEAAVEEIFADNEVLSVLIDEFG
ncbi:SMI1/KNR4 family protein [Chondromyces crocatus]|uniref:Knr4/Smi1-like domain-containing protein n=1 Tax=Chondromyces crocatus TaxID=52 RepID=A0A0K1EHW6_CHOCO|nr:SMI1/KNR4 family protein [Chondromyces crocatus]AKT40454.1 uncharacterized protein CMC5_046090 [Chondromyces crocatus]